MRLFEPDDYRSAISKRLKRSVGSTTKAHQVRRCKQNKHGAILDYRALAKGSFFQLIPVVDIRKVKDTTMNILMISCLERTDEAEWLQKNIFCFSLDSKLYNVS